MRAWPNAAASSWAFSAQAPVIRKSATVPGGRKFIGTVANCVEAPPCMKTTR